MEQEIILQANKLPETDNHNSYKDNGIFDFLSVDRAIELYKEIHTSGIPKLDWKFYGRRKPGEQSEKKLNETDNENKEANNTEDIDQQDDNNPTAFDFDEEFGDSTATIDDSLQLKKRPDKDSEKKTNLSDIMSDILKESHTETIIESSLIEDNTKESIIDSETNNMLDAIEQIKTNLQAVPEEEEDEFMDTREQIEEELKELKEQQY